MAGIVSATQAQTIAARDAVMKTAVLLQQFAQGSIFPSKTPAAHATLVDAAVADCITKLEALATVEGGG